MRSSAFIATNEHLCHFLQASGGSWRNTLYIECGECPRAVSARCRNLLCAIDENAVPVFIPEQDAALLFRTEIDKSECLTVMSRAAFCELYKNYLFRRIRDPQACPITDLHISWKAPKRSELTVFGNL